MPEAMVAKFMWSTAADIATAVASGRASALSVATSTITRIRECNPRLNCFTAITEQRALDRAQALDEARADGKPLGSLAGVPFAVKNMFAIRGRPTLAGSKINRDAPPAARDAALIERLEAAGAVLVGALNMGEYAYDFTGENVHYGAVHNPHDLDRMSGGSSSGSAAAVAGGLVPLSLGSDTNGSIRVPASLCGIFGLKPTYGRLSRARTFPFVSSLDHVGPLARTVRDLVHAYDAMQGSDPDDPVCANRAAEPVLPQLKRGAEGLCVAVARGYFKCLNSEALSAIDRVASALGATRNIDIPQAEHARAAAFIITACESATLHLDRLRVRARDYDPAVRDRLIAGAMLPGSLVVKAQKFRRWYRDQVLKLFTEVDAILAPATPCTAPLFSQQSISVGGVEMPVRANLGIYTQPISFVGLPVVTVPVPLEPLPIGVQIIAAPWREDVALRLAHALETTGTVGPSRPAP
jgi:1-carboxybiuret hydrolase